MSKALEITVTKIAFHAPGFALPPGTRWEVEAATPLGELAGRGVTAGTRGDVADDAWTLAGEPVGAELAAALKAWFEGRKGSRRLVRELKQTTG